MAAQKKIVPRAPQESQRKKLVEEYAAIESQVQAFKPVLSRYEKLRSYILDWYPDLAPEEEQLVPGNTCDILISSRDSIRTVTAEGKTKLLKLWGTRAFIAKCLVHLKSLPDPADELGLYSHKALTGPRHLSVMSRVIGTVAPKRQVA